MKVAVTYAEPKRQWVMNVDVAEGMTANDAIAKSGILAKVPQLDLNVNKIGIFGKLVPLTQGLTEGDRVEIYRPAMGKPPKKERTARGDQGGAEAAGEE